MKKIFFYTVALATIVSSSILQASANESVIISSPEKATIYTNGICTFEEKITGNTSAQYIIQLPPETIANSVKVVSNNHKISKLILKPELTTFTTQAIEKRSGSERIIESTQSKITYYLLSFNESNTNHNQTLKLEYSVKGISWHPTLKANIGNSAKVNMCLEAKILNKVKNIQGADIFLVATPQLKTPKLNNKRGYRNKDIPTEEYYPWEQVKYSASLYAKYPLGKVSIPAGEQNYTIATIACKDTKIENTIYLWRTKEKVTKKYSYILNPFSTPICDSTLAISVDSINLAKKETKWTEPNEPLLLLAENENAISCSSSIEVVENFEKRNLWRNCNSSSTPPCDVKNALFYNHQYEFSCENKTGKDLTVELVFEKKYGQSYKNIYNFEIEPTKSPGWWHIWELKLKNNKKKTIKFTIDSDKKTYKEYKKYNRAIEGC